jgi:hypothetical protein
MDGFRRTAVEGVPGRHGELSGRQGRVSRDLQRQAWQWALANRAGDGSLPSGREIARQYSRHERWGRLIKRAGTSVELADAPGEPASHLAGHAAGATRE